MTMTKLKFAGAAVAVLGIGVLMAAAPSQAQQPTPPTIGAPSGPPSPEMGPGGRWMHRGPMMDMGMGMNRPGDCGEWISRKATRRLAHIERVVKPTDAQSQAFADFKSATAEAAEILRTGCPTEVYLTPPAMVESAEKQAEARLRAIKVVRPALELFYRSLSDEQKAHFNAIMPHRTPKWAGEWRERWSNAWQNFRDRDRDAWSDRGSNDRGSWHRRPSDRTGKIEGQDNDDMADGRSSSDQRTDGRSSGWGNLDQPDRGRQGGVKQPDREENNAAPSEDEERM